MKMGLRRLIVIFVIALLLCISQPFWLYFLTQNTSWQSSFLNNRLNSVLAQTPVNSENIQQEIQKKLESLESFQLGMKNFDEGKFKEAIESFENVLAITKKERYRNLVEQNSILMMRKIIFFMIGYAYDQLKQEDLAINYHKQYLVTSQEIEKINTYPKNNEEVKIELTIWFKVGVFYYQKNKYQEALDYLLPALGMLKKYPIKNIIQTGILRYIGDTYSALREDDNALYYYQQTLLSIEQLEGEDKKVLNKDIIIASMASVYANKKQYEESLRLYQQAIDIAEEQRDIEKQATRLANIASVYVELGRYAEALKEAEKSLDIISKENRDSLKAPVFTTLGDIYGRLAQYDKSFDLHKKALDIYEKEDNILGQISSLNYIGRILEAIDRPDTALKLYQIALRILNASKLDLFFLRARTMNNLGSAYWNLGRYNESIDYYEQALTIRKNIGDKDGIAKTLNNLGLVYIDSGNNQKALESYQEANKLAIENQDKESEAISFTNMAEAYMNLNNYSEAEQSLYKSIRAWNLLRINLKDNDKISIFERQINSYRFLQRVLISQNKINRALEVAESGRARAFVELLNYSRSNKFDDETLSPTISQLKKVAFEQKANIIVYSIVDERFNTKGNKTWQDSQIYIWVIKPTGEITFRPVDLKSILQKENTTLGELVENIRDSIGVRDRSIFKRTNSTTQNTTAKRAQFDIKVFPSPDDDPSKDLQKLHEILIDPIADLLPTDPNERVIFIPQNELFLVPFPALKDAQGKYLIEKHTILTAASIQVLGLTHERAKEVKRASVQNALVVGNPDMPSVAPKIGEEAQPLSKLPGAEKEAEAITDILKENKLKTKRLKDKQATKAAVLELLPQAKIIHLATHGLFDNIQGLQSAIALAPSGKDSGLLTAEEILNLKINADLVVLSACNTGRGRITGDGVIGLSRSLISAGTPSVIVSLWAVPDAPTAELMTEFYKNLLNEQKPLDKAQALRQAMLKFKDNPPKDWAAFTLIGESNQVTN